MSGLLDKLIGWTVKEAERRARRAVEIEEEIHNLNVLEEMLSEPPRSAEGNVVELTEAVKDHLKLIMRAFESYRETLATEAESL